MNIIPYKEDILPKNEHGNLHGYCIYYWYGCNVLMSKGYYTNGIETGYWEEYNMKAKLTEKIYVIP